MKRLFIIITIFFICSFSMQAQFRSAGGVVTDKTNDKPMEYISVYIKNTSSGCVTNFKGEFYVHDSSGADTLVIDAIGYEKEYIKLRAGQNLGLKVQLEPATIELASAVVKPKRERYKKKENPAIALIKAVIANKEKNRIEDNEYYTCNIYEKLTLSLDDYNPDFEKKKKLNYLKQYIDTSEITGKPILTVSIRETMSDYYYRKSPKEEKTIRKAQQHIGIDKEFDHNGGLSTTLEQLFTGVDIFDNEVSFVANRFVSPISSTLATSYYKYYIMDTIKVDGIPCIDMSFVPYNSQSFGFTGRLYITNDGKYSVKKVQLNFPASSNINWIDKLRIDQEFSQTPDSTWVLKREDSYVNLALIDGRQGVFAHHTRYFANHNTDSTLLAGNKAYKIDGPLETLPDSKSYSTDYWEKNRLVSLNSRETNIDHVSKEIAKNSSVTTWMRLVDAFVSEYVPTSGYKSTSKFDFGPILSFAGYDYIEGLRLRVGGLTTANLSKRWFANGYLAYGVKDNKMKGSIRLTHSFNEKHYHFDEKPVNNLSVSYTYDIFSPEVIGDQHGVLTSLKTGEVKKLQYIRETNVKYEKQWTNSLKTSFWAENNKYTPATTSNPGTLRYEKVLADNSLANVPHITSTEIGAQVRWSPGERAFNAVSQRVNIDKDTPIFTLSHAMGIKGFLGGEYNFQRTDLDMFKRFRLSVAGFLDVKMSMGKVWGQVPFPLLIIPAANQSFAYRRETFHMMNALEFVTDQYAQVNMTWHMKGLILNRIPLIKNLKLREVLIFDGLVGSLSAKNDPRLTPGLLKLPEGTGTLGKTPFMEVGFGLENIFKIFKIIYFYRLTYRDNDLSWMGKWGGLRFGVYTDF